MQLQAQERQQLHDVWNVRINKWAAEELVCVRCKQKYFEINNVGSWHCSQHAQPYSTSTCNHPCCGQARDRFGCVKADHRQIERHYTEGDDMGVPAQYAIALELEEKCKVPGTQIDLVTRNVDTQVRKEYVWIRRFDWKQQHIQRTHTGVALTDTDGFGVRLPLDYQRTEQEW